jgi:hypothetical protein
VTKPAWLNRSYSRWTACKGNFIKTPTAAAQWPSGLHRALPPGFLGHRVTQVVTMLMISSQCWQRLLSRPQMSGPGPATS